MTGAGHKRKPKIGTSVFKKAFSFKQANHHRDQSHHRSAASGNASSDMKPSAARSVAALSSDGEGVNDNGNDDDTSMCSSSFDADGGVLIFPTTHRLSTSSSPPEAILDGIPGIRRGNGPRRHGTGGEGGFLSGLPRLGVSGGRSLAGRSLAGRSLSALSDEESTPTFQARSPYQSKKAQKALSPALRCCRSKSGAKYSMGDSAWERRQPASTGRKGSRGSCYVAKERQPYIERRWDLRQPSPSSPSSPSSPNHMTPLPVEVSPAYRFIPIGCGEDDDCSFNSDDYDICKKAASEDQVAVTAVTITNTSLDAANGNDPNKSSLSKGQDNGAPISHEKRTNGSSNVDCDNCSISLEELNISLGRATKDKAQQRHKQDDAPPSLASTDYGTVQSLEGDYRSNTSQQPNSLLLQNQNPTATAPRPNPSNTHYKIIDCTTLDGEDEYGDWFPGMKKEIMKLSWLLTSNCGASGYDTS